MVVTPKYQSSQHHDEIIERNGILVPLMFVIEILAFIAMLMFFRRIWKLIKISREQAQHDREEVAKILLLIRGEQTVNVNQIDHVLKAVEKLK